jgi:predicted nuclease with TOPRIM domain
LSLSRAVCVVYWQVASLERSVGELGNLQAEAAVLEAQVHECECLAALNSEKRLIAMGLERQQMEAERLRPVADEVQRLQKANADLEHVLEALPQLQVTDFVVALRSMFVLLRAYAHTKDEIHGSLPSGGSHH